jgi:lysophospholipase L1-like esterase
VKRLRLLFRRAFRARPILLVSLLSTPLAVIGAEVCLRLTHNPEYRRPTTEADGTLWKNIVHRRSSVPGLDYELKPDVHRTVNGMVITTNSLGMRGPEPRSDRGASDARIVAIGDSLTFGMHVSAEEAWPGALETRLNSASAPELQRGYRRCEVLNMGVSGYSTLDEALAVRWNAMALDPDLVVVGYYLNDPETEPVQQLHQHFRDPLWWEHSALLRFLAYEKRKWDQDRLGGGDLFRYLHRDPEKWKSVVDGFADIAAVTSTRGAHVLLVVLPTLRGFGRWEDYPYVDLHRQVICAASAAGFETLDILPVWRASGLFPADLRVDEEHPSAVGHALVAEAIQAKLLSNPALLGSPRVASATGSNSKRPSR